MDAFMTGIRKISATSLRNYPSGIKKILIFSAIKN